MTQRPVTILLMIIIVLPYFQVKRSLGIFMYIIMQEALNIFPLE